MCVGVTASSSSSLPVFVRCVWLVSECVGVDVLWLMEVVLLCVYLFDTAVFIWVFCLIWFNALGDPNGLVFVVVVSCLSVVLNVWFHVVHNNNMYNEFYMCSITPYLPRSIRSNITRPC